MMKRVCLIVAAAVAVAGCSGPPSLSGVVTLDGQPLAEAAVVLIPQTDGAETVVGSTNQDGRFVITPAAGKSIAYGKYKVVVSKREKLTAAQVNAFVTPKELLPAKYSDVAKTVLEVTVSSAKDVELALKR
jgi:hypothetical protein